MGRRKADIFGALLLAVLAGCAGPPGAPTAALAPEPERVVREIETVRRARLLEAGHELGAALTVEISIRPKDPVTLEILGLRPPGDQGLADGLLEVSLRWKDYVGTEPTSFGGSLRTTQPFGADGQATREQAFVRRWSFELPQPDERVLARRMWLTAKLHPVDVRSPGARTAGRTMEIDGVSADRFRELGELPANDVPGTESGTESGIEPATDAGHGLPGALAEPNTPAAKIFLLAVGAGAPTRDVHALVDAAVAALESARGPQRDALFGALQFLTGQVQGRSVARWQLWWSRQPAPASSDP